MDATRHTPGISSYDDKSVARASPYGMPSWLYVVTVTLVTLGFLVTQVIVNGVRDGTLSTAVLDQWLFPGAYWWVATSGMAFLLLSGLFAGVTPAILVVRAFVQAGACSWYVALLLMQSLAWGYFLTVVFG